MTETEKDPRFFERVLKRKSGRIREQDLKKVLDSSERIRENFEKEGPLHRFVTDGKLLLSMIRDYWTGIYRKVPWWAMASVAAALLYVLNPFDMVADFILFFGLLDDAAVFAACLALVERELRKYRDFKGEE